MDHLDPSFMDSGCKLSSLRSLHDNSSAMSSSFSGGEWHPHKTLEVKKKKKNRISSRRQGYSYQFVHHKKQRSLKNPNGACWGQS